MTVRHTPGRRDLYKSTTAALTGLAAFGSLAGTGYAAGAIAHAQDVGDQAGTAGTTDVASSTQDKAPATSEVAPAAEARTKTRRTRRIRCQTPRIRRWR